MKYFAYIFLSLLSILVWVSYFLSSFFWVFFIILLIFDITMRILKVKLNFWFMVAFGANAIIALIFILISALN
ncbi:hypothetical protein LSG16_05780 [Lactococcus cremoris]|uniref:hypothetical protein n=1 Tax=Lactococcus lactis subsp. cremoris TaxID=1359 RepID=UPI001E52C8B3|nr:hypothetical protein [Lactococcus cremoris]MCD6632346.1 hypothetical protein [Lactococcus cremoris]